MSGIKIREGKEMNIHKIITKYIRDNGYDGLYYDDECGCEINDFMPCEEPPIQCKPGYKVMCTEKCDHGFAYEPGNWHIQKDLVKE